MNNAITLFIFLLLSSFSSLIHAQEFNQIIKTVPSERTEFADFGRAVAMEGDYAIVGAWSEGGGQDGNPGSGAVYILKQDIYGQWHHVQKITADDESLGGFGKCVSIFGDIIVVGAPNESEDESNENTVIAAGAAYIFQKDENGIWNQTQKLVASDRTGYDRFGSTVAISENYAVIAAPHDRDDEFGNNPLMSAGSIYIFKKMEDGTWLQLQKAVASDRAVGAHFGQTLGLSGGYLVVGSPTKHEESASGGTDGFLSGAAYIFELDTDDQWVEVQKILSSDLGRGDQFGNTLSLSGDYVIVGAHYNVELERKGAAYIFHRNEEGGWIEMQKLGASDGVNHDLFGTSVSISGDYAIVSSECTLEDMEQDTTFVKAGGIYVFRRNETNEWEEIQKLVASDPGTLDEFGNSIAISGTAFIVGAPDEDEDSNGNNTLAEAGSAYIFQYCENDMVSQSFSVCDAFTFNGMTYTESGGYMDTIITIDGCERVVSLDLFIHSVDVSLTMTDSSLISNAENASYQWVDCDNNFMPIEDATEQSYFPTNSGSYAVVISTENCIDTSACQFVAITKTEEVSFADQIKLSPNPTKGFITIDLGENKDYVDIKLMDYSGKLVLEQSFESQQELGFHIDTVPGVYILQIITSEGQSAVFKVIRK